MIYEAIRKCHYGSHIWKEGERLDYPGKPKPCEHCAGEGKIDKKVCKVCAGTGRKEPPHHFMPLKQADPVEVQAAEEKEKVTKASLRKEFDDLGAAYNKQWGVEKLQTELLKAKKERGA